MNTYLIKAFTVFVLILNCSCRNYKGSSYTTTADILESIESNKDDKFVFQNSATLLSFVPTVERLKLSLDYVRIGMYNYPIDSLYLPENVGRTNAIDYILGESENHSILILNEAHHVPEHRDFARKLLKGLWENGYRHIGIETLGNLVDTKKLKFPTYDLGYYSVEPTFGNFIREALAIGFEIFPYEHISEGSGNPREIGQAKNIVEYMNSKESGKVFIYCGYDHNKEGELPRWGKAMAGRLYEYLGIDPLTVDQTQFYGVRNTNEEEPFILIDNDKPYDQLGTQRDMYVINPIKNFTERLEWKANSSNSWLKLNNEHFPEKPCLVRVYCNKSEVKNGIPYDVVEITSSHEHTWCIVPNNESYVIYADVDGKLKDVSDKY